MPSAGSIVVSASIRASVWERFAFSRISDKLSYSSEATHQQQRAHSKARMQGSKAGKLRYDTVQYDAAQYSTVQYNTVPYSAAKHTTFCRGTCVQQQSGGPCHAVLSSSRRREKTREGLHGLL